MSILSACTPVYHKGALDPFIDGFKPSCECWELNSGPLDEKLVLLTAKPSFHPLPLTFRITYSIKENQVNDHLIVYHCTFTNWIIYGITF